MRLVRAPFLPPSRGDEGLVVKIAVSGSDVNKRPRLWRAGECIATGASVSRYRAVQRDVARAGPRHDEGVLLAAHERWRGVEVEGERRRLINDYYVGVGLHASCDDGGLWDN
jgi:hypothetical protein